jgi:thioredoxin-related protein
LFVASCSSTQNVARDIPQSTSGHAPISADSIGWYDTVPGAFRAGLEAEKVVMVYFYSDDCNWCKRMMRETFTHPTVIKGINDNFIPVMIDVEKEGTVEAFNLRGIPALAFVNMGTGETFAMSVGFRTPAEMIEIISAIPSMMAEE